MLYPGSFGFPRTYFSQEIIGNSVVTQSQVSYFTGFVYSSSLRSNTLRDAKVPNCSRMFSYSEHFLSQVRHYKADSLRQFERELFLDVILTSQSLDVLDAMFQSRRSQEQKLPIEWSLLLKIG